MSLLGICQSLEHSALGMGIRDSDWIFYFIESLHVFGIILMVSTVAMVDLRLLGLGILRRQPVSQVAGQFLPWTWTGFAIQFVTGSLLLTAGLVGVAVTASSAFGAALIAPVSVLSVLEAAGLAASPLACA